MGEAGDPVKREMGVQSAFTCSRTLSPSSAWRTSTRCPLVPTTVSPEYPVSVPCERCRLREEDFSGSKAILSGPAGGVVGYARTTYGKQEFLTKDGKSPPVIGFDMGGTSTDVSRFAGELDHVFETVTAGVSIQAPQLDITTVAAGGGSRLFYR